MIMRFLAAAGAARRQAQVRPLPHWSSAAPRHRRPSIGTAPKLSSDTSRATAVVYLSCPARGPGSPASPMR